MNLTQIQREIKGARWGGGIRMRNRKEYEFWNPPVVETPFAPPSAQ